MPEHRFHFFVFAVLTALGTWWLLRVVGVEDGASKTTTQVKHAADYFSSGYVKWEMDSSGRLKSKLIADTLTHYRDDGTTHLANPVMTFVNPDAPPWVIQAETGVVSSDRKHIQMNGKAVVARDSAPGKRAMKINSSNLRVQPEIDYAETDEWAELLSPPNRTEGVGMKLSYGSPVRIELFSKVKGKYETK
ncbi:MAG: hypothetical protein Kow0065_01740 [Methylomicrobium sp.]